VTKIRLVLWDEEQDNLAVYEVYKFNKLVGKVGRKGKQWTYFLGNNAHHTWPRGETTFPYTSKAAALRAFHAELAATEVADKVGSATLE